MIEPFAQLLKDLGEEFDLPLHPDKKGACSLRVDDHFHIQLECDAHQENLLIALFICDLPPGKFRENTLRDALRANHPFAQNGTLAYSERNNQLALFSHFRLSELNGKKLSQFLGSFLEKANQWRRGVEAGSTAHLCSQNSKAAPSLFDLKHH